MPGSWEDPTMSWESDLARENEALRARIAGLEAALANAAQNEREECARLCERAEQVFWEIYKGRSEIDAERKAHASEYIQGASDCAGQLAGAIRNSMRAEKP